MYGSMYRFTPRYKRRRCTECRALFHYKSELETWCASCLVQLVLFPCVAAEEEEVRLSDSAHVLLD